MSEQSEDDIISGISKVVATIASKDGETFIGDDAAVLSLSLIHISEPTRPY